MDNMQNGMTTQNMHEHYIFRFDQLEKKIDKTNESIEKLVNVTLIGNGKPSILHRLDDVEKECFGCKIAKEKEAEERKADRKKMWFALGSMLFVFFLPKIWIGVKALIALL